MPFIHNSYHRVKPYSPMMCALSLRSGEKQSRHVGRHADRETSSQTSRHIQTHTHTGTHRDTHRHLQKTRDAAIQKHRRTCFYFYFTGTDLLSLEFVIIIIIIVVVVLSSRVPLHYYPIKEQQLLDHLFVYYLLIVYLLLNPYTVNLIMG